MFNMVSVMNAVCAASVPVGGAEERAGGADWSDAVAGQ